MRLFARAGLLDVSLVYRLPAQTFHLSTLVLDHYVGAEGLTLQRNDLQKVGCGALLVAASYEAYRDVTLISASDLAHMTDDSYTADEVQEITEMIQTHPAIPPLTQLSAVTPVSPPHARSPPHSSLLERAHVAAARMTYPVALLDVL